MTRKFKLIRKDRANCNLPEETTEVFKCEKHDYGCAMDDTILTGIKHISATLDPEGGYPFFTVPLEDLEEDQSRRRRSISISPEQA